MHIRHQTDLSVWYRHRRMAAEPVETTAHSLPPFPATRFTFDRPLGVGAHAQVVRAYDQQLQRWVAVKLWFDVTAYARMSDEELAAMGLEGDMEKVLEVAAKTRTRYTPLREARLLSLVEHPHVVPVLDIGIIEDRLIALVMPYLDGGTATTHEYTGGWREILDAAIQIGWGLAALHEAGILHRDLKPDNVLFNRHGRPYIVDLGLACLLRDREAMAERVGTQDYMAPDTITSGFKDPRDDLYAYCMIVYEMFNGHSPFATAMARELGRVSASTCRGMPRALHKALVRGLAPEADRRWPSVKALLRHLEALRAQQQRSWRMAVVVGLAASFIAGTFVDERTAEADACSNINDELGPIWNERVQGELQGAFGTRKAGDGMMAWANQWIMVRARECSAAREGGLSLEPSACMASTRDRFQATLYAFRTSHLRAGLQFASVIANLPAPEHCIDHPDDADWGYGGLLELRNLDVDVDAVVRLGDLDLALQRQIAYMDLALELNSTYGTARAIYFRAEIHRLEGKLDEARDEFMMALEYAVNIDARLFQAEALMKLAAVHGELGKLDTAEAYAQMSMVLFKRYQPDRLAELLQVRGLALLSGNDRQRGDGVGMLMRAVEMREDEYDKYGRTRELMSQARESYAKGLVTVGRASEAVELLDLALHEHQEEFGHGTWRTRGILREKFLALLALRRLEPAESVEHAIMNTSRDKGEWMRYCEDALWLGDLYATAGYNEAANNPLRAGLKMAIKHELPMDVVARFERALGKLEEQWWSEDDSPHHP